MGQVVWVTVNLAAVTTVILLLLATPLAWWLARTRGWPKEMVAAAATLPMVLPPTVLGFYLLIALGPHSPLMAPLHVFGVRTLAFTFTGLVIGSVIYSLPFALQPLRNAFEACADAKTASSGASSISAATSPEARGSAPAGRSKIRLSRYSS